MSDDLECVSVSKRFGPFTAVDDVSFGVPRGSFFSILGPSGCGKTTLMRMIAGFETPSAGDIRLKGRSVVGVPPNRRNVKMVFQHLALFPMMNVGENIAYGLRCRGEGRGGDRAQGRATCCSGSGCPGSRARRWASSRAGRSSGSRSRAAWCWSRTCCCSTSRSGRST